MARFKASHQLVYRSSYLLELGMPAEENRVANLRAIVNAEAEAAGDSNKKRLGYRAVATATGLGEEYVYQIYTGKKPLLGPEASKAIARAYARGRTLDWFDQPPSEIAHQTSQAEAQTVQTVSQALTVLQTALTALDEEQRKELVGLVVQFALTPSNAATTGALLGALTSPSGSKPKRSKKQRPTATDLENRNAA